MYWLFVSSIYAETEYSLNEINMSNIKLKNLLESLNNQSVDVVVDRYSDRLYSIVNKINNPVLSNHIESCVSTFKDKLSARVNLNIDRLNRLQTKNYTTTLADTWNNILMNSVKQTVQAELGATKKVLIRNLLSKQEMLDSWDQRINKQVNYYLTHWDNHVKLVYYPAEFKTGNLVKSHMAKSHDNMQEEIKQYIINHIYG